MPLDDTELKGLIEAQGKAFAAFKETLEGERKQADALTAEKLSKIEASLDSAVEAKTALEAKVAAEIKEREALELKIQQMGRVVGDEKKAVAIADMNVALKAQAMKLARPVVELDEAGFDAYKAAWLDYARKGRDMLDPAQIKAMSAGSDPDGGYLVPADLGGRIATKLYELSNIRQIAFVQPTSGDKIQGIEDLNEAGAGYAGETTTSGDTTTPQVGNWSILVHDIDTEPKITANLLDDAAVDVEAWLMEKVAQRFARFEGREFVKGTRIMGFTSYATAADSGDGVDWGKIGYVASGASGAFAGSNPADKLFDLIGTLKDAYLPNARFVTRRSVITAIRKFKDSTGNYLWQPSLVAGQPEQLAGYPITRAEDMPALAADSLSLVFGDFRAGYTIVDRAGLNTLRDPYTQKPFIKLYTRARRGGGVTNFEAIKAMKFAAS